MHGKKQQYENEQELAEKAEIAALDSAVDFLGGTVGGIVSVCVGQPLDTVKVKVQTFPHLYKSALQCFMKTLRVEGVRHGLYAGTVPAIMANVAENSVLFMCYGTIQRLIMTAVGVKSENELGVVENGLAGFSAAFFSSLTLCPTELVKCRLQASREHSGAETKNQRGRLTVYSLCRDIYRAEGVRGFFHGLVPTFWREMPGYFFFFASYDLCRSSFKRWYKVESKDDIGATATIISGGLGGCALWAAIFPADVIKSRKQVMSMGNNSNNIKKKPDGMFKMGYRICRQEGFRMLYRGLGPTLLRTFPATGALFLSYEFTKRTLHPLYHHDG